MKYFIQFSECDLLSLSPLSVELEVKDAAAARRVVVVVAEGLAPLPGDGRVVVTLAPSDVPARRAAIVPGFSFHVALQRKSLLL